MSWKKTVRSIVPCLVLPNVLILLLRSQTQWVQDAHIDADSLSVRTTSVLERQPIVDIANTSRENSESSTLADAMNQVVRMLLPRERADEYIAKHPSKGFRFFVYDSLPAKYTWSSFAKCMEEKYNVPGWFDHEKKGNETSNCDWGSSICTQTRSSSSTYSSRRFNRNGDVVLSKIFTEYTGPMRTLDPKDASVFIVPYAATAHCACMNERARCRKVSNHDIKTGVIDHLAYLNTSTSSRHVFLNSVQRELNHPFMWSLPLVVTLEANQQLCQLSQNCGHILQPYVNTNADYQPNHPQFLKTHATNSLEQRDYAIVAAMSGYIAKDRKHQLRKEFLQTMKVLSEKNNTIAGRSVFVSGLQRRVIEREDEILSLYRRSVFCPCIRGDTPAQKRFFDALLSGCIPVVLEYEYSHEEGYTSFFRPNGTSTRLVYPFSKGIFHEEPNMGIDYSELVVAVNGTCGIPCIIPTLEELLLHHPEQVIAMQKKIASVASLFSYGMESNALQHPDAIAGMLVQIRHFVEQQRNESKNRLLI